MSVNKSRSAFHVARRILRPLLPRGLGRPGVEDAAAVCAVFFLSGVSYAAVSWRFWQPYWRLVDVRWFTLDSLGCSLETVVVLAGRPNSCAELQGNLRYQGLPSHAREQHPAPYGILFRAHSEDLDPQTAGHVNSET